MPDGVLAYQQLRVAADLGWIATEDPYRSLLLGQFQPASFDLRLGPVAYRVKSSFLPGERAIPEILEEMVLYKVPLEKGGILERGHVYVIPLLESLQLPLTYWGHTNPKSSMGRIDVFTRVLANQSGRFDHIPHGYHGPLCLEVFSRSFTLRVYTGDTLSQLRVYHGNPHYHHDDVAYLCAQHPDLLLDAYGDALGVSPGPWELGISLSLNLQDAVVGYKARRSTDVVDLQQIGSYNPALFWEPITHKDYAQNSLILEPEEFYLLTSKERVTIPAEVTGELIAYDPGAGEIRTHYAGFFDPGFGSHDGTIPGAPVVFEVRPHDVPFLVEDGQVFGTLQFAHMLEHPQVLYGQRILASHYAENRPFAKYFGPWPERE